jgi:hypothetical protein
LNTRNFKQGAEFTGWLRAPAAERFIKDLNDQVEAAHAALLGACAMSSDPGVQGHFQKWKTLTDMAGFLNASRRESLREDDE